MRPIKVCFDASLFLSITLFFTPSSFAQTLEHRPPPGQEPVPSATASSSANETLPWPIPSSRKVRICRWKRSGTIR